MTDMYDFPPLEMPPPMEANVSYRAIMDALLRDNKLNALQKARIRSAMTLRPRVREQVLAFVCSECHFRGLTLQEGTFGFDWESLLAFIRELLPLILEIISWFT